MHAQHCAHPAPSSALAPVRPLPAIYTLRSFSAQRLLLTVTSHRCNGPPVLLDAFGAPNTEFPKRLAEPSSPIFRCCNIGEAWNGGPLFTLNRGS
jgi:hypothetical protein